jgi:hypothetical protein
MSFETSVHFDDAAMRGASDSMDSAAARIVLGQPVGSSQGYVGIQVDLNAVRDAGRFKIDYSCTERQTPCLSRRRRSW